MSRKQVTLMVLMAALPAVGFVLNLLLGSVEIPFAAVCDILTGGDGHSVVWQNIILKSRVPQTLTATFAGAALSVSGLQDRKSVV